MIRQFDTWPTSVIVLDRVENFTRYPDPISAVATSYDSVTTARKPLTKRVHACTVTRNASCESTYSSKRQILADTSAIEKDQNMNAGSSAMPGPLEPPAQPECCPTPFVAPFDSSVAPHSGDHKGLGPLEILYLHISMQLGDLRLAESVVPKKRLK
uniref:Uncharacterized protein n=1 Tax=Magallana gigas TaxID=29159 RepID=A0A8W8MDQ1_MAGGI